MHCHHHHHRTTFVIITTTTNVATIITTTTGQTVITTTVPPTAPSILWKREKNGQKKEKPLLFLISISHNRFGHNTLSTFSRTQFEPIHTLAKDHPGIITLDITTALPSSLSFRGHRVMANIFFSKSFQNFFLTRSPSPSWEKKNMTHWKFQWGCGENRHDEKLHFSLFSAFDLLRKTNLWLNCFSLCWERKLIDTYVFCLSLSLSFSLCLSKLCGFD